jgi:hypothetical protein
MLSETFFRDFKRCLGPDQSEHLTSASAFEDKLNLVCSKVGVELWFLKLSSEISRDVWDLINRTFNLSKCI